MRLLHQRLADDRGGLAGLKCRCGSQLSIMRAMVRAALTPERVKAAIG